ncbi:hypothetical protein BsWGS_01804 [Bradybaena similaris]
MAASIGQNARLTLKANGWLFRDWYKRSFSTCRVCCGNTWHVYGKPSALRVLYESPVKPDTLTDKGDVKEIKIPDKIQRSPTVILEALASTVNNNINQPMYKSIDDPYLYASTDRSKKQLLASMDSGRKTAQMMISMYPDYFTQIWEEPLPDSYRDANLGYKFKDPSEEALLERIDKCAVEDAVSVYKNLMEAKKIPSQETQEKLLDLLLVFKCKSPEAVSDLSTFVNQAPLNKNAPFPVSTWQNMGEAEEVFNSLPNKTAKAYCSMIRGMAVCFDKNAALDMFNRMKAAGFVADVYTYNMILSLASLEVESMEDVTQFIESIMREMAVNNIRPNVETFNSALANCRRLSRWIGSRKFALALMSEMKACGIEPSLGTYGELLRTFYYEKDTKPKAPTLFEGILKEIEGKEFRCTSASDVMFFRLAMKTIRIHFPDSKYALRLHKFLLSGKHADFLGHRQLQYSYYDDIMSLIAPLEHINVVMELYTSIVPFIYAPTSEVYRAIFDSIQMYDAYNYIPQLYTDLQNNTMFHEAEFTEVFTAMLVKQKHDPQLQRQLCDIANSLINKWQESKLRFMNSKPYMSGTVIGDLMVVFLHNGDFDKAWELYQIYKEDRSLEFGAPSETSLSLLTEQLIERQDYAATKEVLNRMQALDYQGVSPLAVRAIEVFQPSDQERHYFEDLAANASASSSSSSSDSD